MRPYIVGRALRAQPALLGASLTCAAALTVVPTGNAAVTGNAVAATAPSLPRVAPGTAPSGAAPLSGVSVIPAGAGVAQLVSPVVLPSPPVRARLHVGKIDLDVLDDSPASVRGTLRPRLGGRAVELQRLGRHGWRSISHTLTRASGRFVLRYTPRHLLSERVRVVFVGDPRDLSTHRNVGRLRSYRLAGASWYGGGGSLACGGELTGATMGVANKTLPCGTLVTLRYGGRSVRVPVVDRGPYVAGRDFDLTEATKRALGFEGVGEVWSTR
ncbi:MAG TPA: septal ring lytic transglycosylase RlpA family protein [Solirubrobacteraceae bacterium]|nr:septal ring lytic transglycosylase RlpA family protein [Solirubrobacteraceae bacterium]